MIDNGSGSATPSPAAAPVPAPFSDIFGNKLLARQLKRALGVDGAEALQSLCDAAAAGQGADQLARLAQGLPKLLTSVAESYAQFDRDLDLRTRSLALSSEELNQVNEQLRKSAQEETRRARGQLERAIEALDVGFAMYDELDRLVIHNQKFAEIYTDLAHLLKPGLTHREFLLALYRSNIEGIERNLPENRWVEDRLQKRRDKNSREVRINGRWIRIDDTCTADGLTVTLRTDVTEIKEMTLGLVQARDSAQAANKAKSDFLANMSHEIRTPMNGIIGMTALALDTPLNREQTEYLGMVKSSADSLLVIINDILDFSKMEAGMMTVESISFSMESLLNDCLRPLGVRAFGKGLELLYRIERSVPRLLLGDPGRLRQLITNLVGNSIKFTQQGEVGVEVKSVAEQADGKIALRFTVWDTGIGIPLDKQKTVFEAFSQADTSVTRRYGGTGLGLAICTRLVELMGGRIWVESEPGQGSQFHFELSLGVDANAPAQASLDRPLLGRSVLLADDSPTQRKWLAGVLRTWGMTVREMDGGVEALAAINAPGSAFDVVLLDAQMPDMPGLAVAQSMRSGQHPLLARTLIMLPPHLQHGDVSELKAAGLGGYLMKPVCMSDLLDEMMTLVGSRVLPAAEGLAPAAPAAPVLPEAPTAGSTGETPGKGMKVLLAEDNAINQKLAVFMLNRLGHKVEIANNGAEAVRMTQAGNYDLVLMDVQMPVMDGLDATRAIRAEERETGKSQLIIAMTANAMQGDRDRCMEAGMNGYVSKPIDNVRLTREIERVAGRPIS